MKLDLGSGRVHWPVLELAGAAELTYAGVTWEGHTGLGFRVSLPIVKFSNEGLLDTNMLIQGLGFVRMSTTTTTKTTTTTMTMVKILLSLRNIT